MNKFFKIILLISALIVNISASAIVNTQSMLESGSLIIIKANLKSKLPKLTIDTINPTVIDGVFEVVSGQKVFYTDKTGRYVILGNLVDLDTKLSLTKKKVGDLSKVDWDKLPLNIALTQIVGKGSRKIALFVDPDCTFCKLLDKDSIAKLDDLTIYYFLYPLPIHLNAVKDSQKILCSQNPEHTYLDWMRDGIKLPVKTECKNKQFLIQMQEIGNKIGKIEETPTIIFPNGNKVTGFIPAAILDKLINDNQPNTIESIVKLNSKLSENPISSEKVIK